MHSPEFEYAASRDIMWAGRNLNMFASEKRCLVNTWEKELLLLVILNANKHGHLSEWLSLAYQQLDVDLCGIKTVFELPVFDVAALQMFKEMLKRNTENDW